jgi:hypothetical protein
VGWGVSLTADEALAPVDEDRDAREDSELADGVPRPMRKAMDANKAATKDGFAQRTLARARSKLGVVAWQRKLTGHWVMALPEVAKRMREQDAGDEQGQNANAENANP